MSSKSGFPEWGKKAALGRESGGGGEGEHAELGSKHKQRLRLESFPINKDPAAGRWESYLITLTKCLLHSRHCSGHRSYSEDTTPSPSFHDLMKLPAQSGVWMTNGQR